MAPLERLALLVGQAAPDLARDRPREQAAAHPDPPVDPPAIDRKVDLEQRPLPRDRRAHRPCPRASRRGRRSGLAWAVSMGPARRRHSVTLPLDGSSQTSPGVSGGASVDVSACIHPRDEPGHAALKMPRKPREQGAIGRARTDDPHRCDAVGRAVVDGRREIGRLGALSGGAPVAAPTSPKVFHASSMISTRWRAVADADVDRPRWVSGACREFEGRQFVRSAWPTSADVPASRGGRRRWARGVSPSGRENETASG